MDLQDLNVVLLYINEHREYNYFSDIKNGISNKNLADIELQLIIQKLVKDGYIIEEEQLREYRSNKESEKMWGLHISYDGVFLIDRLPKKYKGKPYHYLKSRDTIQKRWQKIENFPKRFWWLIALATFGAGFYSDIFKERFKSKQSQPSLRLELLAPTSADTTLNRRSLLPLPIPGIKKVIKPTTNNFKKDSTNK
ncbi:MAG TPA: hypothetical protein VK559_13595 [Ferruginibacter sp.]|nr:hypothetical protein [Ferruginibacter sp.]